jgi:hypothetical protein
LDGQRGKFWTHNPAGESVFSAGSCADLPFFVDENPGSYVSAICEGYPLVINPESGEQVGDLITIYIHCSKSGSGSGVGFGRVAGPFPSSPNFCDENSPGTIAVVTTIGSVIHLSAFSGAGYGGIGSAGGVGSAIVEVAVSLDPIPPPLPNPPSSCGIPTAMPTATPTTTPTTTATATPSATPTPQSACTAMFPVRTVSTIGNGSTAAKNFKVKHFISGNIGGADEIKMDASNVSVCRGTEVNIVVTDDTGTPTVNALSAGISCTSSGCTIPNMQSKQRYRAIAEDGKDKDLMQFFVID